MQAAQDMVQILETMATRKLQKTAARMTKDCGAQTDDWRLQNLPTKLERASKDVKNHVQLPK